MLFCYTNIKKKFRGKKKKEEGVIPKWFWFLQINPDVIATCPPFFGGKCWDTD
jgi:hypothetical protein